MQIDGETIWSTTEAAEKLGISPTTLKRQRQNGRIVGTKIGRDYFYPSSEIRRYQLQVQLPAGRRSPASNAIDVGDNE